MITFTTYPSTPERTKMGLEKKKRDGETLVVSKKKLLAITLNLSLLKRRSLNG